MSPQKTHLCRKSQSCEVVEAIELLVLAYGQAAEEEDKLDSSHWADYHRGSHHTRLTTFREHALDIVETLESCSPDLHRKCAKLRRRLNGDKRK